MGKYANLPAMVLGNNQLMKWWLTKCVERLDDELGNLEITKIKAVMNMYRTALEMRVLKREISKVNYNVRASAAGRLERHPRRHHVTLRLRVR